jgi:hypothetical protein
MNDFDPKSLIDLDECVMNALGLFADPSTTFPKPDLSRFQRPLVVGSGNAIATGKIIFDKADAVFADEGTFKDKLNAIQSIDGVVLLSASGGKHAPIIAQQVKPKGLPVLLFTCNPSSLAKDDVDEAYVFPSLPEPYTYNTSTYMAMMMGSIVNDPAAEAQKVRLHITEKVDPVLESFGKELGDFDAFYLLVPEEFELIRIMLTTKFVELFGRRVARDVFTWEQTKHATTVVNAPNELFLAFGRENDSFGQDRLNIRLPQDATYPAIMAVGYYVIGKIQTQKPDWFKEGVGPFAQRASEIFGQTIKPIVEFK